MEGVRGYRKGPAMPQGLRNPPTLLGWGSWVWGQQSPLVTHPKGSSSLKYPSVEELLGQSGELTAWCPLGPLSPSCPLWVVTHRAKALTSPLCFPSLPQSTLDSMQVQPPAPHLPGLSPPSCLSRRAELHLLPQVQVVPTVTSRDRKSVV